MRSPLPKVEQLSGAAAAAAAAAERGAMATAASPKSRGGAKEPHILMVPFAASGHLYPFLQLLHRISARGTGVAVTVLTNEERRAELARMRAAGDFGGVDLRVRVAFSRPPFRPSSRFPIRAANVAATYAEEFGALAREWTANKGAPGSPTCVVSDMYLSFCQEFAREMNIPWYPFYSSSPSFTIVLLESLKLQREGFEKLAKKGDEAVDISGLRYAKMRDLPTAALEFPEFYKTHAECLIRASAILINSAEELDAPSGGLEAIRKTTRTRAHAEHLEAPRALALGPILSFPGFTATAATDSTGAKIDSPSLAFLDSQPPKSVLYISFGSLANIAPQAMTELAHGLEASGVPFIWVLKFTGSLTSAVLPPGFEERTRHQGYIEAKWAPQVQILLHPSTGGFLSHCGWNSVLESFCSGVPVITWPVATDQQLNARFIENVARTGVPVKELTAGDEVELIPSREDVQKAVSRIMGENGQGFRAHAKEIRRIAEAAVAEGGSSHLAMNTFLDEILPKRAPHDDP